MTKKIETNGFLEPIHTRDRPTFRPFYIPNARLSCYCEIFRSSVLFHGKCRTRRVLRRS